MEWAVEVEDMTVAYDERPVLWDVDMRIPKGSLAAIVGPNGAGKSTLIKAMLGLLTKYPARSSFIWTGDWRSRVRTSSGLRTYRRAGAWTGIFRRRCSMWF